MEAATAQSASCSAESDCAVLICGLPGWRLGEVIEFVRRSFAHSPGDCRVIQFNSLTDAMRGELAEAAQTLVLWADCPDRSAVDYARSRGVPVMLVDSPFDSVAREFMHVRQESLIDTLRVLACCRMGWWQLAQSPQAKVVGPGPLDFPGIGALLAEWNLPAELPLEGQFAPDRDEPTAPDADAPPLAEDVAGAIADLAAFYGHERVDDAREFTIPLNLLLDGAPPHSGLAGPIELLGPARALSFGPFLFLPEGSWQLTVDFESLGNRGGNTLMFDVFVDGQVKNASEFDLLDDGNFTFSCEFAVRDPWSPFEFRSHMRKGAIEGRFTLGQPRLRRMAR